MTHLPALAPSPVTLAGQYVRLEPLQLIHAASLWQIDQHATAADLFRFLPDDVPLPAVTDMQAWITEKTSSTDPLFYACVDQSTQQAVGRQALMRITPSHGVIEMGHVLWGPAMARRRLATEAFFLFASHVFDTLRYRRFEWKCHALNQPSRAAALRFGFSFEGIFRQHMWVKGANRDTAWFSIIDEEWPILSARYRRWLAAENFDPKGQQIRALADI